MDADDDDNDVDDDDDDNDGTRGLYEDVQHNGRRDD